MAKVTVKDLLKSGVHYGHRTSRWNPKMAPHIFGKRNGIHIINLKSTLRGIIQAQRFLHEVARQGQQVLFVGTKRSAAAVVRDRVASQGIPYVCERWLGGMLTNIKTVRRSLGRLEELEALEESGQINSFSKKMISMLQREKRKITRNLNGVRTLHNAPAAVVLIDPRREKIALHEARKLGLAIVALLDTDCDPEDVDIAIPCNDDAIRSVQLVLQPLVDAVVAGQQARAAEGPADAPAPARKPAPAPAPKPAAPPAPVEAPEAEPKPPEAQAAAAAPPAQAAPEPEV